jgi:putative Mg2+ transporter-C (MgtC) family protein
MMDLSEVTLRLSTASLIGAGFGLNRDLHGKPTGVRTLGLVGFGSAFIVMTFGQVSTADASRVVQGVVTGIGFLGAGVIVRNNKNDHVHGLTTAACVWLTACIGAACWVAEWPIVLTGLPIVLTLLAFGGPAEKAFQRLSTKPEKPSGVSGPDQAAI